MLWRLLLGRCPDHCVYGFPEAGLARLTGADHPDNPTLLLPCRTLYQTANVLSQFTIRGPMLEEQGRAVHGDLWEEVMMMMMMVMMMVMMVMMMKGGSV